MALVKLAYKPGVNKDSTRYAAAGTWADMNFVRFQDGQPEKIGGWQRATQTAFTGTCRSMHAWTDLDTNVYLGIGTHLKYYIERGGALYDITPIRATASLTDPFEMTSGDATVVVNDTAHGAVLGDFVTFSGATLVGGLTIDGEYQITEIIDGDSYTIEASSAATATTTGGGSVDADYQINVGLDTAIYGNGFGAGTWGGVVFAGADTGWGDATAVGASGTTRLRLWSEDNFGSDLIINPRDGGIYYWASGDLTARAEALSALGGANDTPTIARQVIVSEADRKVIAFACDPSGGGDQDRLLIRWSNTEDPVEWEPLETNSAGDLRIPSGAEFIAAVETKQEILVFSDDALHSLRYVGAPYEYGINQIGFTSIAAPNAAIAANDMVFWMGSNRFYAYNGRINPLPCSVQDYVFNDMNMLQAEKIVACSNIGFSEVWWFYPSSTSVENDRYVCYNYQENLWMVGQLARTAWIDRSIEDQPRAASTDGYVYFHEYGLDDGSTDPYTAINAYIQSGPMEIGEGENFGFAWRLIPDVTFSGSSVTTPSLTLTLKADEFPGGNFIQTAAKTVSRAATLPVEQFTEQLYFRLRGRSVTLRVESDAVGVAWKLGVPRIDVRPDGKR